MYGFLNTSIPPYYIIDQSSLELEVKDWLLIKNKRKVKVVEITELYLKPHHPKYRDIKPCCVKVRNVVDKNKYRSFWLRRHEILRKLPKGANLEMVKLLYGN